MDYQDFENGKNDYDCCERGHNKCDRMAQFTDVRLDMEFCSQECADAEIADREDDYEANRRYEIATGGQG